MNWLRSIEESRLNDMFHKLANELIEKELLDNPQEFDSPEERAELGLKLTLKWQEENSEDMESKLVEKYGTIKDNVEYTEWKAKRG